MAGLKSEVKNMTVGNPTSLMISFMIPMVIGNIFQQMYNMVDSMVVGRFVGADALAAVGATGSLNWMFFSLCSGLANGIGIIISQYFGSGNLKAVRKTIANSAFIIAAVSIVMGVVSYLLTRPVLQLLNTPDNIIDQSVAYMHLMCGGILFISLYNTVSAVLRGLGDSRTPLYFLIASCLMNVIMDLVFVTVFHWGVIGAGVATVLSQLFSGIGALGFAWKHNEIFRIQKDEWKPDSRIIKESFRLGVPLAAQSSLIALSCVILQSVVNSFGSVTVAAFTATSRVEQLVQQPYQSLSMAISTFTGQNIGAGKQDRVKKGFSRGFLIMLVFTVIMVPLIQLGGRFIMTWFVSEPEVIELGASAMRLTSWFYFPLGLIYVCRGLLNGAGDAEFSMINGVTEMAGRILFPKPLTMVSSIGVYGVWLGTAFTWLLVSLVALARYLSGAWKPERRQRRREKKLQVAD